MAGLSAETRDLDVVRQGFPLWWAATHPDDAVGHRRGPRLLPDDARGSTMTDLQIRRPAFRIDDTVPFQWQPANPAFGVFGNAFTFVAITFERYIVNVVRQAMPLITDPEVAAEADAFLRQEAQHARAHRHHAKVLTTRYPGLADTLAATHAAYDELLAEEPLAFHLAYIADLEATFTPLFRMVFDHRGPLFEGGDERVGTLLLWHFAEEIEHRSSALVVQRHLAGDRDRWYRLRVARRVFGHVSRVFGRILAGFEEHVPLADSQVPAMAAVRLDLADRLPPVRAWRRHRGRPDGGAPDMLAHVPTRALLAMLWGVLRSQSPRHDPAHAKLPAWAATWHAAYDAGADVTTYTGICL